MALRYYDAFIVNVTKTVCFDKAYGSFLRKITNTIATHNQRSVKIAITFTLRFYMLFSVFWRKISNTKASLLGSIRGTPA